jgi:flagellar biosynthetic protein FliR
MTQALTNEVLLVFIVFCRLGTCLMIMPGLSSLRVPVRVRLLLALALSASLVALVPPDIRGIVATGDQTKLVLLAATEVLTGALFGFMGRVYYAALQFCAIAMANFAGLAQLSGTMVNETDPMPELALLVMVSATLLLFLMDLHWEIIAALVASYKMLPMTAVFDTGFALDSLFTVFNDAFMTALRVTSPFVVYAVLINVAIGVANRLQPNIPVFFVSMPLVILGGLLLLYFTLPEMLLLFENHFANWLRNG